MPSNMNPRFPIYIPSKGRHLSRFTMRALDEMQVPYFVVVEQQQLEDYASVMDRRRLLVLDPKFQDDYDPCDDLGSSKSKGSGPARNFAWEHARAAGHEWYWCVDDNIRLFYWMQRNHKYPVKDGTIFYAMEDFCLRYANVGMAGPAYEFFTPRKAKCPPFVMNTRIYSCNLIRTDLPFRWRCRWNEDTDLSLRMLKAGWCTVQFNAFLQKKLPTQSVKGGNTEEYQAASTKPKSEMLVRLHPDVSRVIRKWGRWHHFVDYRRFKLNRLILRPGVVIPESPNNFGINVVHR